MWQKVKLKPFGRLEGDISNKSPFRLRRATAADAEFIEHLTTSAMRCYVNEQFEDEEERKEYWTKNATNQIKDQIDWFKQEELDLRSLYTCTFIIESKEEQGKSRVGRITLSFVLVASLYLAIKIQNVHVSSENRGQGIFKEIFKKIQKIYPQNSIFLEVLLTNNHAYEMYTKRWCFFRYQFPHSGQNKRNDSNRARLMYEPEYVYRPDRAFYLNKFSGIMEKLRDQTVIFSTFVVIFELCKRLAANYDHKPQIVADASFQVVMCLIFCAVIFSLYDIIAGNLYVQFKPQWPEILTNKSKSWMVDDRPQFRRVMPLLFLEMAMIATNSLIIIMSFIHGYSRDTVWIVSYYYAIWHFINFLWYCASPVYVRPRTPSLPGEPGMRFVYDKKKDTIRWRDFGRHGFYAIAHVALVLIVLNLFCENHYRTVAYLIGLLVLVSCTIIFQGRRYLYSDYIRIAQASHESPANKAT